MILPNIKSYLKQLILQYVVLIISSVDEINLGLTLIYWTIGYDFTTLVLQLLLLLLYFNLRIFVFFVFVLFCIVFFSFFFFFKLQTCQLCTALI